MSREIIYPSIFYEEGKRYNISFPDFSYAFTFGENLEDGLYMAKDCLELCLSTLKEDKLDFPKPSSIENIKLNKGEKIILITVNLKGI